MTEMEQWQAANDRFLAAEMATLRRRLERLAATVDEPAGSTTPDSTPPDSTPPGSTPAGLTPAGPTLAGSTPLEITAPVAIQAVVVKHRFLRRGRQRTAESAPIPAPPAPAAASTPTAAPTSLPPPVLELPMAGSMATPSDPDLGGIATARFEAESHQHTSALTLLAGRFGLTDFERQTLLLCAAMELDTRMAGLCGRAQGDPTRPYPTFALALAAFDDPAWDVLSPERPLRYWRLIEIHQPGGHPLVSAALKADERIVNFLKGLNYLDDRLTPLISPIPAGSASLPPSQQAVTATIVNQLQAPNVAERLTVFQLLGADSASKVAVASQVAAQLDFALYRLTAGAAPSDAADQENFVRLWQRESALMPIALYIDAADVDRASSPQATAIVRICRRGIGMTFIDVTEPWPELFGHSVALDVAKPTTTEQRDLWVHALGPNAGATPSRLAGQFNLNGASIVRLAAQAGDPPDQAALWDACLREARPSLAHLAQVIVPLARWDDLELSDQQKKILRQIADQVGARMAVYDDWGFRDRMNRGLGISVLFAGESGTGKTMAAEVIANELHLALYRIDLSAVVNKYIGETEKNLRKLFDGAEDGGAILFFDEADALFGKRSEVKDSHDRYANIEINYLLQRMEAYRGLAILATNAKSALDSAFVRRLRFIVDFRFPGFDERVAIWQRAFPAKTPVDRLDYQHLARFNLAGGSIHNIAVNSAFLASTAATRVTMPLVLDAVRSEFAKLEKPVNEGDFRWLESVEETG